MTHISDLGVKYSVSFTIIYPPSRAKGTRTSQKYIMYGHWHKKTCFLFLNRNKYHEYVNC